MHPVEDGIGTDRRHAGLRVEHGEPLRCRDVRARVDDRVGGSTDDGEDGVDGAVLATDSSDEPGGESAGSVCPAGGSGRVPTAHSEPTPTTATVAAASVTQN